LRKTARRVSAPADAERIPVRLVVPGKFGVYWTKHLTWIRALTKEDSNFWMAVPGGQERRQGGGRR
jgi:DMSO/TMAO reductase YedYZ molybdopterin-dependent catalytic subunit